MIFFQADCTNCTQPAQAALIDIPGIKLRTVFSVLVQFECAYDISLPYNLARL